MNVGDRGDRVKRLQEGLIAMGGQPAQFIQSSGGADGIWGNGTSKALVAAGYNGQTISEADYNNISLAAIGPPANNPLTQKYFWEWTVEDFTK
jgi:hypothetical protein